MKSSKIFVSGILMLGHGVLWGQWVQTGGPPRGTVRSLAVSGTNLFTGTSYGVFLSTNNRTRVMSGRGLSQFSLPQNSPNPFTPLTEIAYQLPFIIHHSLKVFDLLGREVAVLVDEEKEAGIHTLTWNASGMPSGVYFVRLMADGYTRAKRMSFIR